MEDENGNALKEFSFELDLESIDLKKYKLLKYVDPYGDTTFNCMQMDDLINDFNGLIDEMPQLKVEITVIIELANTCKKQVHQYLKFYGD